MHKRMEFMKMDSEIAFESFRIKRGFKGIDQIECKCLDKEWFKRWGESKCDTYMIIIVMNVSLNYLWCDIFLGTCLWNEVNWYNLVVNDDYVLVLYMLDEWSDYVLVMYMLDKGLVYENIEYWFKAWIVVMYYMCFWLMNSDKCFMLTISIRLKGL